MDNDSVRYKARMSILSLPAAVFDEIVSVLDANPQSKNWRALVNLANYEFRLSQLEIEKIASAIHTNMTSPARQALLKLESLGFTIRHLVYYLEQMELEILLVYLKNYEPIIIKSMPVREVALEEGEKLHLRVSAVGFPYPRYQWFNGDIPVDSGTESELIIRSVRKTDGGLYCCRLHNSANPDLCVFTDPTGVTISPDLRARDTVTGGTSSNYLNDLQGSSMSTIKGTASSEIGWPVIVQQPKSLDVSEGETVTLDCIADGERILKYRWICDGHIIQDSQLSSLTVNDATLGDSGRYECIVYNNYGHRQTDPATVNIIADQAESDLKSPMLSLRTSLDVISQPKSLIVEHNGCALFRCVGIGEPPVNYQWFKDCIRLEGETRGDLIVSDVSVTSEACYQCRVWNQHEEVLSCGAYLSITESASADGVTSYSATDKLALLIGNFNYENVGELKAPKTDVHVLSECFRAMKFKVVSLLNLTLDDMHAAVTVFCDLLADHNSQGSGVYVVFYFCGHGFQDNYKQCYLLPVDAPQQFSTTDCICAEYILDRIQKTQPALCCVILDCCRTVNEVKSEKKEQIYYPQPHGNTIFLYATTFGMQAFEYEQTKTSFMLSHENGILVKHLQVNLCKKQSIESVFALTREAISEDPRISKRQIPEVRSNLQEPRRSLVDRIVYRDHTEVYSRRSLKWSNAHKKPEKRRVRFDEIGAVVDVDFQGEFSNVLSVYFKVVDRGCTTNCRPIIEDMPRNVKIMGRQIISHDPIIVKIILQDLQKLRESLKMRIGLLYPLTTQGSGKCVRQLDFGYPLVSVLELWKVDKDTTTEDECSGSDYTSFTSQDSDWSTGDMIKRGNDLSSQ